MPRSSPWQAVLDVDFIDALTRPPWVCFDRLAAHHFFKSRAGNQSPHPNFKEICASPRGEENITLTRDGEQIEAL